MTHGRKYFLNICDQFDPVTGEYPQVSYFSNWTKTWNIVLHLALSPSLSLGSNMFVSKLIHTNLKIVVNIIIIDHRGITDNFVRCVLTIAEELVIHLISLLRNYFNGVNQKVFTTGSEEQEAVTDDTDPVVDCMMTMMILRNTTVIMLSW